MTSRTTPSRYDKVSFYFLGPVEEVSLPGMVLLRDGEMVIVIPGGDGPYHIVGKMLKHWYEGKNSDPDRRNDVDAKWTELSEEYVGRWIEEGYDYFFSFRLP